MVSATSSPASVTVRAPVSTRRSPSTSSGAASGGGPLLGAAQDRADAQGELARAERLDDVVVGADLETGDPVLLLAARGEHDDGQVGALGPQPSADLEAVDAGQHEVEDDEVGRRGRRDREGGQAVGRVRGLEPVATQVAEDDLGHGEVVVDDEHAGHGPSVGSGRSGDGVAAASVTTP